MPILPRRLASGVPLRYLRRETNEGAAARNAGVRASDPDSSWIVMLDDDSYPTAPDFAEALFCQPADVWAVSADIWLPRSGGARESGGLPEVFIGCGVAIRRERFLQQGGYDAAFNYYAEEYDLAARIIQAGGRIAFDPRFIVHHLKDMRNRDFNTIIGRLVRNNGWVMQRYAPESERIERMRETRTRYRRIAMHENSVAGYTQGLIELRRTLRDQPRREMSQHHWDRFTGLDAARYALHAAYQRSPFRTAAIVDAGKNAWVVARALDELGVRLTGEGEEAEAIVIGTMSPGPLLDAWERRIRRVTSYGPRVLTPWVIGEPATRVVHPAHTRITAAA